MFGFGRKERCKVGSHRKGDRCVKTNFEKKRVNNSEKKECKLDGTKYCGNDRELRPIIARAGGKSQLADKIISKMKPHKVYSEPFCLTENTEIICNPNIGSIKSIEVGDKVLSHQGYNSVEKVFERNYSGELLRIRVMGDSRFLEITPNHLILAVKKPSKKVYIGQRKLTNEEKKKLHLPFERKYDDRNPQFKNKNSLQLLRHLSKKAEWIQAKDLRQGDFLIRFFDGSQGNIYTINIPNARYGGVKRVRKTKYFLDKKFLRLIGLYLAEGNLDKKIVGFSFHKKEQHLINFVKDFILEKFDTKGHETNRQDTNGVHIRFSNMQLVRFFKQFGNNARDKFIPPFFKKLSKYKQEEIIRGMIEGDGCRTEDGYSWTSASYRLSQDFMEILFRQGILPTYRYEEREVTLPNGKRFLTNVNQISIYDGRCKIAKLMGHVVHKKVKQHMSGRNLWFKNESYKQSSIPALIRPINKIEKRDVTNMNVFNLQVENSNSYTTPIATVHNCGGGAVFLKKPLAKKNYINDKDKDIARVFKSFKNGQGFSKCDMRFSERKGKIIRKKKNLSVCNIAKKIKWSFGQKGMDVSLARTTGRFKSKNSTLEYQNNHLQDYKEKLKNTNITSNDFKKSMDRVKNIKNSVSFLDPPYYGADKIYKERGVTPKEVCDTAKQMKGQVLITYNDVPEVRKHCSKGFKVSKISSRYTLASDSNNKKSKELLIINY